MMERTPPRTREMNMERARVRSFFLEASVPWDASIIRLSSVQPSWFWRERTFRRVLCWSLKLEIRGSGGEVWSLVKVSADQAT